MGVKRGVELREEEEAEASADDEISIDEFVGVVGTEPLLTPPPPISGRVPDLNEVERVSIKLGPLPLTGATAVVVVDEPIRRLGGGDGGGNGTPG